MRAPKVRLDALVRGRHELSWAKARDWVESGKIWIDGKRVVDPGLLVDPEAAFEVKMNAPRAAASSAAQPGRAVDGVDGVVGIVFRDSQIVVVDKPSGMNTVPFEPGEKNSLDQMAARQVGQARLIVVHRIDRETSGLVAFARTQSAGDSLSDQFRRHEVRRRYFALAQGRVEAKTIRSSIAANRGDGLRGSVSASARPDAKAAVTHVTPIAWLDDVTLVECRLETGRTHQIRIHLAEDGHPLLGEKAYNRYFKGRETPAPRIMLHAASLGFTHPTTQKPMDWSVAPPADFLMLAGIEGRKALETRLR